MGSPRQGSPARAALVFGGLLLAAAASGCASANPKAPGGDEGVTCDGPCAPPCSGDGDCNGGRHCDTKQGVCVPCLSDSHCPPGEVCSPSRSCVPGCSMAHPDCGDAGVCDPDTNTCAQCLMDSDCTDPATPRCDTNQRKCFPCLPTNDNCGHGSYCEQNGGSWACASGCKDDTDCTGAILDGGAGDGGASDGGASDGGASDGGMAFVPGTHCVQNRCSDCKIDTDCPLGKICKSGACTAGCSNIQGCPAQLACCAGQCADTTLDYLNCGMCGHVCINGNNCCNSQCTNPQNDVMNCGGCGVTCTTPNGVPGCAARQCVIAGCNPGFAHCTADVRNGCETNIGDNVNNCGTCNNPCSVPNGSPSCLNGLCGVAGCNFGFGDCDGDPKNGCETLTATDPNNCGGCKAKCAVPNASAQCVLGMCQVGTCAPGYMDCNNDPHDGCEVDITSNPNHCGGCNTVCLFPSCVASVCACNKIDVGASCGTATAAAQQALGIGGSTQVSANLIQQGSEAWYEVSFANNTDTRYHPKVTFAANPNNEFQFDIYAGCGQLVPCGDGNSSNGRTTWEVSYNGPNPGADPNSHFAPVPAVGAGGSILIRVFRPNGPVTCDTFTLTISN